MSTIFTEHPWIADTGPIAPALSGADLHELTPLRLKVLLERGERLLPADDRGLRWAHALSGLATNSPDQSAVGEHGLLLLSSLCLQVALMWARAGKGSWVTRRIGRRGCFDRAAFSGTTRRMAAADSDGAGGFQ